MKTILVFLLLSNSLTALAGNDAQQTARKATLRCSDGYYTFDISKYNGSAAKLITVNALGREEVTPIWLDDEQPYRDVLVLRDELNRKIQIASDTLTKSHYNGARTRVYLDDLSYKCKYKRIWGY